MSNKNHPFNFYCKIRIRRTLRWKSARGVLAVMLLSLALSAGAFGQQLYYSFSPTPTTNWTSYSVPLVETAGWTVGSPGGPAPTQAQFQAALGSLDALSITLNTESFLDNVSMAGLATSTFNGCTADGWILANGSVINCQIGNPAPSIGSTFFQAPGKFVGNQSAAYGGNLTFDLAPINTGITSCVITLMQAPRAAAAGPNTAFEWGPYNSGMGVAPPGMTNVAQISAGVGDVLALRTDGTVVAWGSNIGALTNVPAGLTNIVAVSAGYSHNLALRSDGTVTWWGQNTVNTPPSGLSNVVAICAGANASLALRSDGTVVGWGTGFSSGVTNPPAYVSNVVAIASLQNPQTPEVNLALRRDGSVLAWPDVTEDPARYAYLTNVPAGLSNVTAVAAGGQHFLALMADGTVMAWGTNVSGQTNVPAGLTNVVAIAGGNSFSMALRQDGTVVGWGDNTYNETNIPTGLSNVVGVAGGGNNALALIGTGPPQGHALQTSPQRTDGVFGVAVSSQCGRVYALEYKLSLTAANWTPLPLVAGTGGMLTLSDATAAAGQRFYRVRRW
jgi:hypothetical protein